MAKSKDILPSYMDSAWWDTFDYPEIIWEQHFGNVLSEKDLYPPIMHQGYLIRPRTRAATRSSGKSEVVNDDTIFLVKLNAGPFKSDGLEVEVIGHHIVITGEHEEMEDEHGFIERKFSRHYTLPQDCDANTVKSTLMDDGHLVIEVQKKRLQKAEVEKKVIPIGKQGPVKQAK